MKEEIKTILVDGVEYIYASKDLPITEVLKNGEMEKIIWYKQGNREWNSKYVVEVEYYENPNQ